VPARTKLKVVVLSTQPVWYVGHWVGNRMQRHWDGACVWCEQRRGRKYRYCFSVLDADTRAPGLLELGAATAEVIMAAAEAAGRLRGLVFSLRKDGGKERGRVLVTLEGSFVAAELLPAEDDPLEHLDRQWSDEGTGSSSSASTYMPAAVRLGGGAGKLPFVGAVDVEE
jgi:hypothetical protein